MYSLVQSLTAQLREMMKDTNIDPQGISITKWLLIFYTWVDKHIKYIFNNNVFRPISLSQWMFGFNGSSLEQAWKGMFKMANTKYFNIFSVFVKIKKSILCMLVCTIFKNCFLLFIAQNKNYKRSLTLATTFYVFVPTAAIFIAVTCAGSVISIHQTASI